MSGDRLTRHEYELPREAPRREREKEAREKEVREGEARPTEEVKETKEFSGDPLDYLYLRYLAHGLHVEAVSKKHVLVSVRASRKGTHELFKELFGDYAEIKSEPVTLPKRASQYGLKCEVELDPSFGFMARRPTSIPEPVTDKEFEAILSGLVDGRGFLRADVSRNREYRQRVEIIHHSRSLLDEVVERLSLTKGVDADVQFIGKNQYRLICTEKEAFKFALLLTRLKHGEKVRWRDFFVKAHFLNDEEDKLRALKELQEKIGAENEEYIQEAKEKMFKPEMKQPRETELLETDETEQIETATKIEEKVKPKEVQVKKRTPLTREPLHELYWEKRLSIDQIAEKTGWGPSTVRYHMMKHGMRFRSPEEGRRLRSQHEVERARQCIRLNVPEFLKDLDVEYTKDGRIKVTGLPLEIKEKLKDEALRLREKGWGVRIVAKALGLPEGTVDRWFFPSGARKESTLRWHREHKEDLKERRQKEKEEAGEDLIEEFGGRCQKDGVSDHRLLQFHHLEKAKEERRKAFLDTKLGRRWRRYRKTKHRKEVLEVIRKKVILLCGGCHNKVTAKENSLRRRLTREEILPVI